MLVKGFSYLINSWSNIINSLSDITFVIINPVFVHMLTPLTSYLFIFVLDVS